MSTSYKPITLPDPKEIVINEGETLNVSCKDPMKFVFPDNPEVWTINFITLSFNICLSNQYLVLFTERKKKEV